MQYTLVKLIYVLCVELISYYFFFIGHINFYFYKISYFVCLSINMSIDSVDLKCFTAKVIQYDSMYFESIIFSVWRWHWHCYYKLISMTLTFAFEINHIMVGKKGWHFVCTVYGPLWARFYAQHMKYRRHIKFRPVG